GWGRRPRPPGPGRGGGRAGGGTRRTAWRCRLDHRLARRTTAREQVLDLAAGQGLELQQALGEGLEIGALLGQNALRLAIARLNQLPDLGVDLLRGGLGDVLLACDRIAEEDLFLVLPVGDGAELG